MTTYRRRSDARFRVVDGEAVVLSQAASEVVVLNTPPTDTVEWWDESQSRWRPTRDLLAARQRDEQAVAMAPSVATSQVPSWATSQLPQAMPLRAAEDAQDPQQPQASAI